jgi:hypothetical protein
MSKIARQITMLLAGHDMIAPYQLNDAHKLVERALEGKIISKRELDALRKDADVFKRELYLKNCALESRIAELNGQLAEAKAVLIGYDSVPRSAFQNAAQYGINQNNRADDLANKLWDAEQEIHDLKLRLELEQNAGAKQYSYIVDLQTELNEEKEANDRVTDEWEALVKEQDQQIKSLAVKVGELEARNANQSAFITEAWAERDKLQAELKEKGDTEDILRRTYAEHRKVQELKKAGCKHIEDLLVYAPVSSQSEQTKPSLKEATQQFLADEGVKSFFCKCSFCAAETIEPPSCLKPADALNWTSTQVYGGSEKPEGWTPVEPASWNQIYENIF